MRINVEQGVLSSGAESDTDQLSGILHQLPEGAGAQGVASFGRPLGFVCFGRVGSDDRLPAEGKDFTKRLTNWVGWERVLVDCYAKSLGELSA
jgi:hypothetical protein